MAGEESGDESGAPSGPRNQRATEAALRRSVLAAGGPEWKGIVEQAKDTPKLLALTLLMRRAGLRIS